MSNFRFRKSALAVAVLSLGVSMGAFAQGSAGSSASGTVAARTGPAAAQGGTSGADAATAQGATSSTDATARDAASGTHAADRSHAASDRSFIEDAHAASMAEIRLGRLAQQKAASEEVKQFGQRMIEDHTKALADLGKIAKAEGVQLPSQLDARHQATYDRLQKLSGAEFDREYMKAMNADHRKTIERFETAAQSADKEPVQQFAQQTLPTLREHKQLAESTQDDLRKSSTVSMKSQPGGGTSTSQSR